MKTSFRDLYCGNINEEFIGKEIKLCGWVKRVRDLGGMIFFDLRDREGYVQCVVQKKKKEIYDIAKDLKMEDCVQVKGIVRERKDKNPNIKTGNVEVEVETIKIFSKSKDLPFIPEDNINIFEETRLKYRFLDLRRNFMQRNIIFKHKLMQTVREFLNKNGFIEIETPFLSKSTPEGARDFLVPSRLSPGKFYALPQSPQLYKQILMVSGFDRYYQIVRCFRDEDLRRDRQPEFTQVDIEMSFVCEEDIFQIVEELFKEVFDKLLDISLKTPFPRIKYFDSINKYGSDKPDLRVDWKIKDFTNLLKDKGIKIFENAEAIYALEIDMDISRKDIEKLNQFVIENGGKGITYVKYKESLSGTISKFLTCGDLIKGNSYIIIGDKKERAIFLLGKIREECIKILKPPFKEKFSFLFITHFPLYIWDEEEKRWEPAHHPFTMPLNPEDIEKTPSEIIGRHYDLVLNGVEIGSGSIRNHDADLQKKILKKLGYSDEEIENKFGFLLEALRYGAPPHGGIALGFDRITAILLGLETIRDVIPFPKTTKGYALFEGAPSFVNEEQLRDLKIFIKHEED
ncbi:MAG: aspartate--tRNA ligase [candidate division WOR-3 bacterium]